MTFWVAEPSLAAVTWCDHFLSDVISMVWFRSHATLQTKAMVPCSFFLETLSKKPYLFRCSEPEACKVRDVALGFEIGSRLEYLNNLSQWTSFNLEVAL